MEEVRLKQYFQGSGELSAAVVSLYIVQGTKEQQCGRDENKFTTTASRIRERMIHQIFMLVISSQHLKREDKMQQLLKKNSQKCLSKMAQLLFCETWRSFALRADEVPL